MLSTQTTKKISKQTWWPVYQGVAGSKYSYWPTNKKKIIGNKIHTEEIWKTRGWTGAIADKENGLIIKYSIDCIFDFQKTQKRIQQETTISTMEVPPQQEHTNWANHVDDKKTNFKSQYQEVMKCQLY